MTKQIKKKVVRKKLKKVTKHFINFAFKWGRKGKKTRKVTLIPLEIDVSYYVPVTPKRKK